MVKHVPQGSSHIIQSSCHKNRYSLENLGSVDASLGIFYLILLVTSGFEDR